MWQENEDDLSPRVSALEWFVSFYLQSRKMNIWGNFTSVMDGHNNDQASKHIKISSLIYGKIKYKIFTLNLQWTQFRIFAYCANHLNPQSYLPLSM